MDTETPKHSVYCLSAPYKSIAAALVLTIFFGPIGLLYSNFWGGLLMTILIVPGLFMPATHGTVVAVVTFWLLCSFLAVITASRYNRKLFDRYTSQQQTNQ